MSEIVDARWRSWNRRLARRVLRPFADTPLQPNYITTLRIVTGLAACAAFAVGTTGWAGILWVVSTFLDRCDGEFARMTGRASRFGKIYDFAGDVLINALVFLAIGIGLEDSFLGQSAMPLGFLAAAGVAVAAVAAETNERGMPPGRRTFNGAFGFDFDDFIYLVALFAWANALVPLLAGAALGGPAAAVIMLVKLPIKRRG